MAYTLIVFNLINARNKTVKIERRIFMCGNITTHSAIPRKRNHFKLHAVL